MDGDEDQESLIQSKSQRRSSSEVDMSGKERYASKIEDKVALEACSFEGKRLLKNVTWTPELCPERHFGLQISLWKSGKIQLPM